MRRLFFIIMATFIANGAYADWSVVINRSSGSDLYADPTTVRRSGTKARIWLLWDNKEPKKTGKGEQYLSSKHQVEYDCKEERDELLYVVDYEDAMGKGRMVSSTVGSRTSLPIVPGSIGEGVWLFVCGKRQ